MADLPLLSDIVSGSTTEAAFQAAMTDLYDFIVQNSMTTAVPESNVIASGTVAPSRTFLLVDTEAMTSTDNLDNILATSVGAKVILIKLTSAGRVVTLRHLQGGTGQLYFNDAANVVLDSTIKMIAMYYNTGATRWEELWRNWGFDSTGNGGGTVGGTANAITLTPTPPLAVYKKYDARYFVPTATNTSGTVTANVSALGVRNIKKFMGAAIVLLAPGDIMLNQPAFLVDDGTQYILMNPQNHSRGAAIASAATLDLTAATGDVVHVTGTTPVTAITLGDGREVTTIFDAVVTLTFGVNLIIPGVANYATAAGDSFTWRGDASGVVRCTAYTLANGKAIISPASSSAGKLVARAYNRNTAYVTGGSASTTIAPTIATGTQILSVTHTAADASNIIRLAFTGTVYGGNPNFAVGAILFDGNTPIASNIVNSNYGVPADIVFEQPAGDILSHTYSVRICGFGQSASVNASSGWTGWQRGVSLTLDEMQP